MTDASEAKPSNGISFSNDPETSNSNVTKKPNAFLHPAGRTPVPAVHSAACNELKPQPWYNSTIANKSCPARPVRMFSFQKKCTALGSEPTSRGPATGLQFMGSFKKLRSSVLQSIQNRAGASDAHQAPNTDHSNGFLVTKKDPGQDVDQEMTTLTNGLSTTAPLIRVLDDEDDEDGSGLHRNSHFSRSIRRAYRTGRIPLLDHVSKQPECLTSQAHPSRPRPCSSIEPAGPESENQKFLTSRLTRSADNLHVFKSPSRRKVPPNPPQSPETPSATKIHRSSSATSVDTSEGVSSRSRRNAGVRGRVRKFVGSLTDLSGNQKPAAVTLASESTLSRLHDDYSRRTPCRPVTERQRRPTPPDKQKSQAEVLIHTSCPVPNIPSAFPDVAQHPEHGPEHTCVSTETEQNSGTPDGVKLNLQVRLLVQFSPLEAP